MRVVPEVEQVVGARKAAPAGAARAARRVAASTAGPGVWRPSGGGSCCCSPWCVAASPVRVRRGPGIGWPPPVVRMMIATEIPIGGVNRRAMVVVSVVLCARTAGGRQLRKWPGRCCFLLLAAAELVLQCCCCAAPMLMLLCCCHGCRHRKQQPVARRKCATRWPACQTRTHTSPLVLLPVMPRLVWAVLMLVMSPVSS